MIFEITRKMTAKEQMAFDLGYAKGKSDAHLKAHWETGGIKSLNRYCANCKERHVNGVPNNFCPRCGAEMIKGGPTDET